MRLILEHDYKNLQAEQQIKQTVLELLQCDPSLRIESVILVNRNRQLRAVYYPENYRYADAEKEVDDNSLSECIIIVTFNSQENIDLETRIQQLNYCLPFDNYRIIHLIDEKHNQHFFTQYGLLKEQAIEGLKYDSTFNHPYYQRLGYPRNHFFSPNGYNDLLAKTKADIEQFGYRNIQS